VNNLLGIVLLAGITIILIRTHHVRAAWVVLSAVGGAMLWVAGAFVLAIPAILSAAFVLLVFLGSHHSRSTAVALAAMDDDW
jgi:hypothetical protein